MDLLNGFWQVMVKEEHKHKTAFVTSRGLFEFVVMPFGLCNAPATFQRLMDTVIKPEYRSFIETYVDDVMTHSQSFTEHVGHLETLLNLLREHKLVVKLTKCKFAQREVKFLGHILSEGQLKPNPESVATILKWERPTQGNNKQKAIKGFLGMVGWYRKFIPHFAEKARPLFELLKKDAQWEWTDACQRSFECLRDAITSKPVLAIADPNKPYILDTDASDVALGAVLMQKDEEGYLRPVAYASKSLGPAEKNYGVTDREALAIVWALEHFNTYCEGHKYTAVTDHAALRYMLNNKDKTPRMHRMVARLSPYEITLEYRPGAENHAADLLSRQDIYMQMKTTEVNANRVHKKRVRSTLPRSKKQLDGTDYEVEAVVNRRPAPNGKANEYEYEVKWKGYDNNQNTWLSLARLGNAMELLTEYEKARQVKEIGAVGLEEEDDNVCGECKEKCNGPIALIIHRYQQHRCQPPPPESVELMPTDTDTMRDLQQTDKSLQFIHNHLNKQEKQQLTNHEAKALASYEFLTAEDGLLYCIPNELKEKKTRIRTAMRLVIPTAIREQVMAAVHASRLSAHPGIVRMIDKMKMYVWWLGMYADVVRCVTTCVTCQRVKAAPPHVAPRAVRLPTRPWQILAIDAVGPLPKTKKGNEYIIDVVCCFTHYVEGWAAPGIDMVSISRAVIEKVVCRYGLFEVLVSDRGSVFVGTLAADVFRALRIKRVHTTAQHPQSNGMIERFHETLKVTLKLWSHEVGDEWDDLLAQAIFAYNTAFHTTLQEVPHYLAHGYDARLPLDEILGSRHEIKHDVHQFAADAVDRLQMTYARITSIMEEINAERKTDAELAAKLQFKIGEEVWLYEHATKKGENAKLKTRWLGPYKVIEKKSDVVYVIEREGQAYSVNIARLKRAHKQDRQQLPEDAEESRQRQLQLIEEELRHLSDVQQQLLAQQKQKQQQRDNIMSAAHVAKQAVTADNENDESTSASAMTTAEESLVESMCAEMYAYAHDVTCWQQ
jgi:hypothetical protein